jgi:16S rRNA processing protein RimM
MAQDLIAVGRMGKSVGVRGEVRVEALTDRVARFRELTEVWVGADEATARRETVEAVRFQHDTPVVKLRGVDSRDASDRLRGCFLFVDAASLPPLPEGSFYIHDIIGMTVATEEGKVVGTVKDVQNLPGGDVWCVDAGGNEVMIPAVREFIRTVDMQKRTILIRTIEGLFE